MIAVQQAPGHCVASLDKTLNDDYLCFVASNKNQIYVGSINMNQTIYCQRTWFKSMQKITTIPYVGYLMSSDV